MIKVAMIGVSGVLLAVLLKQQKNEYALYISLGVAVCILLLAVNRLVVETVGRLGKYIQIDGSFVRLLLKMLGITYVAEFAAGICKDAGYANVSTQIEMFAKFSIMALSMPILLALIETIEGFLQ